MLDIGDVIAGVILIGDGRPFNDFAYGFENDHCLFSLYDWMREKKLEETSGRVKM